MGKQQRPGPISLFDLSLIPHPLNPLIADCPTPSRPPPSPGPPLIDQHLFSACDYPHGLVPRAPAHARRLEEEGVEYKSHGFQVLAPNFQGF